MAVLRWSWAVCCTAVSYTHLDVYKRQVLSMHSPFEVIHKTDLYMAYRTFSLFCQNADE